MGLCQVDLRLAITTCNWSMFSGFLGTFGAALKKDDFGIYKGGFLVL